MRKVLNSKEKKILHRKLEEQYGYSGRLSGVIVMHEKKEKLYILPEDVALFPTDGVRVDSYGLYIGAYFKGQVRLTIEGSQMIGPGCSKNVIDISKEQMQAWLQGDRLERPLAAEPGDFVIIRYGQDYMGCGKVSQEEILNYVPKTRYIHALH